MATYSFQNVTASIVGSGVVDLGFGSGNAKEGITVEFNEPRNAMYIGADFLTHGMLRKHLNLQ